MSLLFVCVAGAFATWIAQGYIRHAFRQDRLPPAGPPPLDRGEAVRRVLRHLQRKTIGELEEGTGAVVIGVVRALPRIAPLDSPVTHTKCLGYHLDIRAVGFDTSQLHDDARCVAIEVTDDTGTIRIDPQGLELAITDAPIRWWAPPHPPGLLARLPPSHHNATVAAEEGLLLEGARVLVCGLVARELEASEYRDGAPTLVLRASATFPLVASTDADLFDGASRPIAPEELRTARR